MKRIEVIVDSDREDIKEYLQDILREMYDHDEVRGYRIRELGEYADDGKNRVL